MSHEKEPSVVLTKTRTGFEAEAIASALQARGVDARAVDTASAALWSGMLGGAGVIVLEDQEQRARQALSEIRATVTDIDWSQVDVGDEASGPALPAARNRRWVWTLCVLLVPTGIFLLSWATRHQDTGSALIGGMMMLCSLTLAAYMLIADRPDATEDDEAAPPAAEPPTPRNTP